MAIIRRSTASSEVSERSIGESVPHSVIIPRFVVSPGSFSSLLIFLYLNFGIWSMSFFDAPSCFAPVRSWVYEGSKLYNCYGNESRREITSSATAYRIAIIHGRQQQTARPTTQASATQNTTKKTSKPRNMIHSLQVKKKHTRVTNSNKQSPKDKTFKEKKRQYQ